ncbi:MAG: hypothetical protein ABIG89_07150 [Candidatus Woesearchaeota archaeon]
MDMYPAVSMNYNSRCREHKNEKYDKTMITLAYVMAMICVLFFNGWTLRLEMWGALTMLYFAVII